MEPTVVGIVHADDGVRRALSERLEGEQGILLAAVAARFSDLQLPDAGTRVLVVGGAALDDPDLARAHLPIVVAASGRIAEARAALALGALDLIGWPRDANELPAAIRRAAVARGSGERSAEGRVIAVVGARGGLGTTTVAAWLARAMHAQALVELDAAGTLSSYGDGADPLLATMLSGTGAEHARNALREIGFGVPVCFGEPSMREPEAPAIRALLASLRALGGWSIIDAGRGDGGRLAAVRGADLRLLVACDEVAAVRAVTARRLAGTPWLLRQVGRRGGVATRDLTDAFGAAPLGTLEHDPGVTRAAAIGTLAAAPAVISMVASSFDASLPAVRAATPRGARLVGARLRGAFGAFR